MASVAQFLIERLENAGVRHAFGVPGDYVLDFYVRLGGGKIRVINTTDEAHAGFAADAYARVNGIGCCCTTYNVGTLKLVNAVACAYAERSPVVVISGSPGVKERSDGAILDHMIRSFNSQADIFRNITCASAILDNPTTAGYLIDQAFEAMRYYKQPIYIELPRDVANKGIVYDVYDQGTPSERRSDPENLAEAIDEVTGWLGKSRRPAILAGVELARYGLQDRLVKFAERLNIPVATTLLSKSTVDETHPNFAGVYAGPASEEHTRKIVDDSDCLLMFGVLLTDVSLSFKPSRFRKRQVVHASVNGIQVRNHNYSDIVFSDFCTSLFRCEVPAKGKASLPKKPAAKPWKAQVRAITTQRLFEKIGSVLDPKMAVVADIGDALFGAGDLVVRSLNHFLSPAFYTSMGFALPASIGVQLANPEARPIVLVGDGAFQMSVSSLSTSLDLNLNPIVIVLNNDGYATERFLKDGSHNDIRRWDYHRIVGLLGGGEAAEVQTEADLDLALDRALRSKTATVINVHLARGDVSPGMRRMAEAVGPK